MNIQNSPSRIPQSQSATQIPSRAMRNLQISTKNPQSRGDSSRKPMFHPSAGISFLLSLLLSIGCWDRSYGVGATVPFVEYEAESGVLNGGATVQSLSGPPTTPYSSPQLEASGRAFVRLNSVGQSVRWTNNTGANVTAINLRYCIPDSSTGRGITATLNLYVNGTFRQAVTLT